ncbi:5-methylthioadenosine/S-adenosylhomocysteine deaminase [Burkholderiales bacterium]|nr:5-methylthioadenosine/S-adenosylhomocysteine deaminase [Burkholderiales bacterium]
MQSVEAVIEARWLLPVRPRAAVLENHAVAVDRGRIVDVLPIAQARTRYQPTHRVELPRHALLPGLINAHGHSAMSLLRGVGDDLPLTRWLEERIWPLERAIVSPDFVYDGTRLAAAEMLRAGITCCNDMYFYPLEAAQAMRSLGLRAVVGILTIDFPSRYATDADDYLRQGLAARDALLADPMIQFTLAPHAPYTVSDQTLARIATLAEELDLPVHMHVHETAQEVEQSLQLHGARPLERLDRLGLVSERLIAVHATQLLDAEVQLLAQRGACVAHCPASNLQLASGTAPVAKLLAAGVGVAIGTDGAASNNRLDILGEVRLATLLAKGYAADATAAPAWQGLECATLAGAKALGLEARIGSIEVGKEADLTAVDLGLIETQPCYDVISQVLHCAGRENVTHVWVAGQAVLADRAIAVAGGPGIADEVLKAAAPWHNQVRQRLRRLHADFSVQ